nr:MtrAB system histidine kinase MtrB [Serinicoccus sp. CUA-874]
MVAWLAAGPCGHLHGAPRLTARGAARERALPAGRTGPGGPGDRQRPAGRVPAGGHGAAGLRLHRPAGRQRAARTGRGADPVDERSVGRGRPPGAAPPGPRQRAGRRRTDGDRCRGRGHPGLDAGGDRRRPGQPAGRRGARLPRGGGGAGGGRRRRVTGVAAARRPLRPGARLPVAARAGDAGPRAPALPARRARSGRPGRGARPARDQDGHPTGGGGRQASQEVALGHLDERLPVVGNDEIAQLATSFNTMADSIQHQIRELRSLSQLQQRFVSDVSHELRTPLTTMRMAGDVLHASREDFTAPVARSAELLDQEMDRFEDLLAELLEISRFDSGAVTVERHEEDIVPTVRAAVDGVRTLADNLGTSLRLHLPQERVEVCMDGRRVSRVLRNLLTNAVEHGEGRPVDVTVAVTPQVASISVRDHGIGMDEEQRRQVFDRFWRADPARTRTTGGTGLGLAIALEDARVHGGWLQVGSEPGQGACFRLLLPRTHTHVIAEEPSPVPSTGSAATDAEVPAVVLALDTREDDS